jgi:RHH-type transcriptional regulator, rel operon repressor / antitoxin RelB
VESRLDNLAAKTGRTKTYYARAAICEYLDDFEDYYLADARTRNKAKAIPIDEVERQLGLAD